MSVFGSANIQEVDLTDELNRLNLTANKPDYELSVIPFGGSVVEPTDAPTRATLRVFVFELSGAITKIEQIWLYAFRAEGTGKWQQISIASDAPVGGGGGDDDALVVQSTFSPNGLITSARRGQIAVYSPSVLSGVASVTGAKIFMAINANSNNSWVQIN